MLNFRRVYYDSPTLKPLLRGFFLLPAYAITIYHQLTAINPSIIEMLIYWSMHIQLVISLLFHILHFGVYDRLSCYIDRLSVIVVNSVLMVAVATGLQSYSTVAVAALTPILFVLEPEANIKIVIIQFTVGFVVSIMDAVYNPCNGLWWIYNTLFSALVALIYVLEIYTKFPIKNRWIGWHDIFHILINFVYINRLISIPGIHIHM